MPCSGKSPGAGDQRILILSTDDKFTLKLLSQVSSHLGVDNVDLARAICLIDDRTLLEAIFKDIAARKKLEG